MDTIIVCSKHWDQVMDFNDQIASAGVKGETGGEAGMGFAQLRLGQTIEFRKDAPDCPICRNGAL